MGYEYAILEVKEFSNKEQKKIRHNYDIARGFKKALEEGTRWYKPDKEKLNLIAKGDLNKIKHLGRIANKSNLHVKFNPENINEKITGKQAWLDSIKDSLKKAKKAAEKGGRGAYDKVKDFENSADNYKEALEQYKKYNLNKRHE